MLKLESITAWLSDINYEAIPYVWLKALVLKPTE